MKSILTITFLALTSTGLAQIPQPFPVHNAAWYEVHEFPTGSFPNFGTGTVAHHYRIMKMPV